MRRRFGREPGQALFVFAVVAFFVALVMLYSLYNFADALLTGFVPDGYVLR